MDLCFDTLADTMKIFVILVELQIVDIKQLELLPSMCLPLERAAAKGGGPAAWDVAGDWALP